MICLRTCSKPNLRRRDRTSHPIVLALHASDCRTHANEQRIRRDREPTDKYHWQNRAEGDFREFSPIVLEIDETNRRLHSELPPRTHSFVKKTCPFYHSSSKHVVSELLEQQNSPSSQVSLWEMRWRSRHPIRSCIVQCYGFLFVSSTHITFRTSQGYTSWNEVKTRLKWFHGSFKAELNQKDPNMLNMPQNRTNCLFETWYKEKCWEKSLFQNMENRFVWIIRDCSMGYLRFFLHNIN